VGLKLLAVVALAVAVGTSPAATSVAFLEQRQAPSGGFAEAGGQPDVGLTAWAALALVAGGDSADARTRALAFLRANEGSLRSQTDVALAAMTRSALGDRPETLLARLRPGALRPGDGVNAMIWTALAFRQAGEPVPRRLVNALRAAERPSGGWSWTRRGVPDSNDTAAALEALRAAGVRGRPIARGLSYLARCRNRDGGYGLQPGRASDAQSTAWAIQALIASGARLGAAPFRFLAGMRQADGSYRYSAGYATTPVWVTAQVVPALARKPFPLR
jgi:hypothetical protein